MKIQLFVPSFSVEECLSEIRECLENGWTGLGFKTLEIERLWNDYTGLPHSHFVSSATAGLHLAVKIFKERYGWKDGDEVISTPLTFVSTNHAIIYENLKVTFADVDEYGCLDPDSVLSKINSRTRAVIFVGLGGNSGRLADILTLCRDHDLRLILDAAHMAGTRVNGAHVGQGVDATVFSFQAVKNMPTADSGMLCFAEAENDAVARKQSWLGINKDTYTRTKEEAAYKWQYEVDQVGYKYHGNSIMAAIGLVQLRYLDRDNAYRRQLARWYDAAFAGTEIERIPVAPGCESSRHLYQILLNGRDTAIFALNSYGIFPGVHYRDNTEYSVYNYAYGTCPNANHMSNRLLSLPLHMRMTKADVDYVASNVIKTERAHHKLGLLEQVAL